MAEDWLNVGKELVEKMGGQDAVRAAAAGLEWIDIKANPKISLPFSQGFALKEIIRAFNLNPLALAYHTTGRVLDGHGFYGVEAKYADRTAKLYVIDDGLSVTPVLSVHEPLAA